MAHKRALSLIIICLLYNLSPGDPLKRTTSHWSRIRQLLWSILKTAEWTRASFFKDAPINITWELTRKAHSPQPKPTELNIQLGPSTLGFHHLQVIWCMLQFKKQWPKTPFRSLGSLKIESIRSHNTLSLLLPVPPTSLCSPLSCTSVSLLRESSYQLECKFTDSHHYFPKAPI